jgi:hypothetical protein
MEELERLIQRFIDLKISKSKLINVRDKEFALMTLKKKIDDHEKWLGAHKELKTLYSHYLLGGNVIDILNSDGFYQKLSPRAFPNLFKAPKRAKEGKSKKPVSFRESFDIPENLELPVIIDERIPEVRKVFIEAFKKYLAFKEFQKLVEKDGSKLFRFESIKKNASIRKISETEDLQFFECFKDKNDHDKLLITLETKGFFEKTNNIYKWVGVSKKKSEPAALFAVLIEKDYMKVTTKSKIAIAFSNSYAKNILTETIRRGFSYNDKDEFSKIVVDRNLL